ncbi:MAG TPA: glycosyltransferase family 2 protein [Ferruginibacter sp.]|nr:glycosyltransferase family 2 protein [Ferruginibacter sp.]HMP19696.1 glycosyltransferase family 2 protein [Ferruginibacter sp.]
MTDVVIINWNSGSLLYEAVQSICTSQNINYTGRIIIIDNASTDNSADAINISEKILLIRNAENRGFAKACNQGFKLCSSPFVLLLNPDARLLNNTLPECILFMQKNENIDVLGCQLLDELGKVTYSCSRFPTPLRFFYDAVGLSKIAPAIFTPATIMTDWNHQESREVNQVMGAFMFMRHSVFKKTGYFDERFFVYFEELDFSKRIQDAGGSTYYNAAIQAVHKGEGTTSQVKAFRLFLNLNSRLEYAKKHFSHTGFYVVWVSTFLIEPFSRLVFTLVKGQIKDAGEIISAYVLLMQRKKYFKKKATS